MSYPNDWEMEKDRQSDLSREQEIADHRKFVVDYLAEKGVAGYSLGKGSVSYLRPIHVCVMDPQAEVPEQIEVFVGEQVVPQDSLIKTVQQTPKENILYRLEIIKDENEFLPMTITCDSFGNIGKVE